MDRMLLGHVLWQQEKRRRGPVPDQPGSWQYALPSRSWLPNHVHTAWHDFADVVPKNDTTRCEACQTAGHATAGTDMTIDKHYIPFHAICIKILYANLSEGKGHHTIQPSSRHILYSGWPTIHIGDKCSSQQRGRCEGSRSPLEQCKLCNIRYPRLQWTGDCT